MQKDELRALFLPRFIVAARERLERARVSDFSRVAGELHSLAGEAMLLGLAELSAVAVEAEEAARRCFENADPTARAACARSLHHLTELIASLDEG
jgi:HPt (histidine-containing phosphotransfer) domain-containing protein